MRSATQRTSSLASESLWLTRAFNKFVAKCFFDLRAYLHCRLFSSHSVMATDIVDKELKQLRNARWDKAFYASRAGNKNESRRDAINRKATIVIEHLIQASDVAHTMQHWYACFFRMNFCFNFLSHQHFSKLQARLPQVERTIFHGMLQSIPGRSSRERSQYELVPRGTWWVSFSKI